LKESAKEVLNYLNLKSGRYFRTNDTNIKFIEQRLKDLEIDEFPDMKPVDWCKAVIDKKCFKWKGTEWEQYLRPSTIFNKTKFEDYLSEVMSDLMECKHGQKL